VLICVICGQESYSFPFEVAAVPGPDEAFGKEQDEDEHCDKRADGKVRKRDGKGEEKEDLHVEDQEENTSKIRKRIA
jgi:hypothetical protein